jgi:hypothetical protein
VRAWIKPVNADEDRERFQDTTIITTSLHWQLFYFLLGLQWEWHSWYLSLSTMRTIALPVM